LDSSNIIEETVYGDLENSLMQSRNPVDYNEIYEKNSKLIQSKRQKIESLNELLNKIHSKKNLHIVSV
jgi:hypothetical protein